MSAGRAVVQPLISTDAPARRRHRPAAVERSRAGSAAPQRAEAAASRAGAAARGRHILHVFPSFAIGGVPLRMVRVINHLGGGWRHTIAALDGDFAAAERFAAEPEIELLRVGKTAGGTAGALFGSARVLGRLRPDLLVTYNWGAVEWAAADRLSRVAPQLHFEAGFSSAEADRQLRRRVLFRRWALARCSKIVVPSRRLEELALRVWKLPRRQILHLPNGVDLARFADPPRDPPADFARRPGELVIGTVAPLRPEKNLGRLLRVFAALPDAPPARLVVAGDGGERVLLERLARELGIAERVLFTGTVLPEQVLGGFDLFALSSDTEQMPNALLEAMAAGRAVAAVDVGDVRDMLCAENRDFVVPRGDEAAFTAALARLLGDSKKRSALGGGNRAHAVARFSQQRMFAAYAALFDAARSG